MSWIRSLTPLNYPPVDSVKVISEASNVGQLVTDERIDQWSDGTIETALDVVNVAQIILST